MPEVEILPIVVKGKSAGKLLMIYGPTGWTAQVVSNRAAEVVGKGTELLGKESAQQIAIKLAEKWRDAEAQRT